MKLFKVTIKKNNEWEKSKPPLYVIKENKKDAIEYVKTHLRNGFRIDKIFYLADSLSFGDRLFTKINNKGK